MKCDCSCTVKSKRVKNTLIIFTVTENRFGHARLHFWVQCQTQISIPVGTTVVELPTSKLQSGKGTIGSIRIKTQNKAYKQNFPL